MPFNSKIETDKLLQKINKGYFKEWIERIQQNLGLTYIQQKNSNPNLCFKQGDEVRDEYKTHFNSVDFAFFLLAIEMKMEDTHNYAITIPKTTREFWDLVNLGNIKFKSS